MTVGRLVPRLGPGGVEVVEGRLRQLRQPAGELPRVDVLLRGPHDRVDPDALLSRVPELLLHHPREFLAEHGGRQDEARNRARRARPRSGPTIPARLRATNGPSTNLTRASALKTDSHRLGEALAIAAGKGDENLWLRCRHGSRLGWIWPAVPSRPRSDRTCTGRTLDDSAEIYEAPGGYDNLENRMRLRTEPHWGDRAKPVRKSVSVSFYAKSGVRQIRCQFVKLQRGKATGLFPDYGLQGANKPPVLPADRMPAS